MVISNYSEPNNHMLMNVGGPNEPGNSQETALAEMSHFRKFTHNPITYETCFNKATDSKEKLEPLSLKFIHKPKRSDELLEQASDFTEYNSKMNAKIGNKETDARKKEDSLRNRSPSATDEKSSLGLVRKKSGELVKPSLKDSSGASYFDKKRSLSLPTTPTYKSVHFGGINDIRYFKQKDRPTAISASNSPTLDDSDGLLSRMDLEDDSDLDNSDFSLNSGDTRYPYKGDSSSVEWTLELLNFSEVSYDKKIKKENLDIFLERIYLSDDNKSLIGHIAVKNIAFEKYITVRYTLDNWLTVIEIPTTYSADAPSVLKNNNYDRFIFRIPSDKLFNSFRMNSSLDNLNDKNASIEKLYNFCFRYITNQHEYWDNNDTKNYTIKFRRTTKRHKNIKIEDHRIKPRYSSSYLARRASDSELANTAKATSSDKNDLEKSLNYKSPNLDSSDFVSNDFYLSSPLLSSLKSNENNDPWKDRYNDIIRSTVSSPDNKPSNFNNDLDSLTNPNQFALESKNEPLPVSSLNKNLFNTKSYKELLDNYCFFSSSPEDSIPSSATHSNRSSISFSNISNSKGQLNDEDPNPEKTISISTFLGT